MTLISNAGEITPETFWTPPAEKIATLAAKMNASLQQFLPVNSINSSL